MENDIETTAHRRWVTACVWNLTGLVAYNNNKNSNKNDNKSIFQRTKVFNMTKSVIIQVPRVQSKNI